MKPIFLLSLLLLTGCGVNVAIRAGIDIDPSIERLTADIRELMDEQSKGESDER